MSYRYALLGAGKTGSKVSELLTKDETVTVFNRSNPPTLEALKGHDAIISFLPKSGFEQHMALLKESRIPVITGSTGVAWPDNWDAQLKLANCRWILSHNFALGMSLFKPLVETLSKADSLFNDAQISIHEIHHTQKQDMPSGTALSIAQWLQRDAAISSDRIGDVVGEHRVTLETEFEDISLTHKAKDRGIFARGALWATRYLLSEDLPAGLHLLETLSSTLLNRDQRDTKKTTDKPDFKLQNFPLFTALITPFTAQGEVDYSCLEALLHEQQQANNGILLLGSTGEALNMDLTHRKQVIEFCCQLDLDVPIMVGVGGSQLGETLDWVRWLNKQAIDMLLMVTPLYAKPGRHGQTAWFKALLDASDRPAVLYNVPGRTATSLHLESITDLLDHPNFFGIKESSGSEDRFNAYAQVAKGKMLYCGDDGLLPEFTALGAQGLISVAANAWPQETHHYVRQNLIGEFDAKALWRAASDALFSASNPIPVKALLAHLGRINSDFVLPPLHSADMLGLQTLLTQNQAVNAWYQKSTQQLKQAI